MKKLIIIFGILFLFQSAGAFATENRFKQFNADVGKAYSAYRVALFQTNKKNGDKSAQAVQTFLREWQEIQQNYGPQPPEIFSTDPQWEQTLATIEVIASQSATQIGENHVSEAHQTLEAIRDELSDLRKRNSVIVFSDHINNYHQVMESLLERDLRPAALDSQALSRIRGQLAVLTYLAGSIKKNAPASLVDNKQFRQLQEGLFTSLASLAQALDEGNPEKISKAVKMLKPAYAKLFLNFG